MKVCEYIYIKGNDKGKQCCKKIKGDNTFCSKHNKNNTNEDEKEETISIVSTVNINEENKKEFQSCNSVQSMHDDDILLSKYFVYDCIKDYIREHHDFQQLFQPIKKSEGSSNMTSIMAMAGIGVLPFIIKNLTNSNILNALHQQENTNESCNSSGIRKGTEERDSNTKQGVATYIETANSTSIKEGRSDNTSTETINQGHRVLC